MRGRPKALVSPSGRRRLPVGLKPPPPRAPRRLKTTADLRTLQRLMTHAVVQPLAAGDTLQSRWIDGRAMAEVAGDFIKANDRLTAFERLQIYNRMYWFRLIGCVTDDCPGLRSVLGELRFDRLVRAYLAKYPSRSFTLRNLCSRLPQFIREEPRWTAPRTALALEVARFEWAQTVAFDGPARPVLVPDEIARVPPGRLRLDLQPYLSLLVLSHRVHEFVMAVKRRDALRTEASNAVEAASGAPRHRRVARPRRERIYLAVHRLNNRLYYKRLDRPAYLILAALRDGKTLSRAVAAAGRRLRPADVQEWFATWMKLGWLCRGSGRGK